MASFGGPLALATLAAPGIVDDASDSAGLSMVAAAAIFALPMTIWLRYSRQVSSSGGLFAFVEAAGRRVALAQAGIWIVSFVLYLLSTTVDHVDRAGSDGCWAAGAGRHPRRRACRCSSGASRPARRVRSGAA